MITFGEIIKAKREVQNLLLREVSALTEIDQTSSFVGYYIKLRESNSLKLAIKSIAVQVNKIQTVRLFLYNLNKKTAEKYIDVITENFEKNFEVLSNWILDFTDRNNSGNVYLLGYYEHDAVNPQVWQLNADAKGYNYDNKTGVYLHDLIIPIRINKQFWNWTGTTYDLPQVTEMQQDYSNNVIFSYIIDVDYTNLLIDNKVRFAELLQYTFALRLVQDFFSNAFNQIQQSNLEKYKELEKRLKVDLNGFRIETEKSMGFSNGLVQNLLEEFSGIDNILFPLKRTLKF
jgi:hypothetical protein